MKDFSKWFSWENRNEIDHIKSPGIYCLAISKDSLENTSHKWIPEVCYVGKSNNIKKRLYAFDRTISGNGGHGGASRFLYKYRNYNSLVKKLFVCIDAFDFDPDELSYNSLRGKGNIVQHEYHCMASYFAKYRRLPEFNDETGSPKILPNGRIIDRSKT